jgi:hypothetical protein
MLAFDRAKEIADAVLYEGYLLYPYTASAPKNRIRWQFGVIVPEAYTRRGTGEPSSLQAEMCARIEDASATVAVRVRFLQIQARIVDAYDLDAGVFRGVMGLNVAGEDYITWDEAVEREIDAVVDLRRVRVDVPIDIPATETATELRDAEGVLRGRILRRQWPLRGSINLTLEPIDNEYVKLRVRVVNDSEVVEGTERAGALRTALISTHALLAIDAGAWLSQLDPPGDAEAVVALCENQHVFPVLVGDASADRHTSALALASPIILYDFPRVAPQSRGNMFDGTEIDELLNLSVLSLSDAERREARATDPAAREIVDRAESLEAADFSDLHGVLVDESIEPGSEHVLIRGVKVETGSRVRLHPKRRADVWDSFIDGRDAHVKGVYSDMEGNVHVAVTVDDDPASEFHEWYGRALFFHCDEVEPLEETHR